MINTIKEYKDYVNNLYEKLRTLIGKSVLDYGVITSVSEPEIIRYNSHYASFNSRIYYSGGSCRSFEYSYNIVDIDIISNNLLILHLNSKGELLLDYN